jgi:hypothetical protein
VLGIVLYPLKKLLRKIFFFLEWKRAVDTASRTFYFGTLLDHALAQRWCAPAGPHDAVRMRAAIDRVLRQIGTALVERVFRETFKRSARTLRDAASLLQKGLRKLRRRPTNEQVSTALDALDPEGRVEGVAGEVQHGIEQIPAAHWDRVRALLATELDPPRSR